MTSSPYDVIKIKVARIISSDGSFDSSRNVDFEIYDVITLWRHQNKSCLNHIEWWLVRFVSERRFRNLWRHHPMTSSKCKLLESYRKMVRLIRLETYISNLMTSSFCDVIKKKSCSCQSVSFISESVLLSNGRLILLAMCFRFVKNESVSKSASMSVIKSASK